MIIVLFSNSNVNCDKSVFLYLMQTLCQLVNIIGEEITEEDESFFVVGTPQNNLDMFVGPDRVTITIRDDLDGVYNS